MLRLPCGKHPLRSVAPPLQPEPTSLGFVLVWTDLTVSSASSWFSVFLNYAGFVVADFALLRLPCGKHPLRSVAPPLQKNASIFLSGRGTTIQKFLKLLRLRVCGVALPILPLLRKGSFPQFAFLHGYYVSIALLFFFFFVQFSRCTCLVASAETFEGRLFPLN